MSTFVNNQNIVVIADVGNGLTAVWLGNKYSTTVKVYAGMYYKVVEYDVAPTATYWPVNASNPAVWPT